MTALSNTDSTSPSRMGTRRISAAMAQTTDNVRDEQVRQTAEPEVDLRLTVTWTVSECFSLPFQFAASVHIERIGSIVFPVRRIPPVEHVVSADVQEGGGTNRCTQLHQHKRTLLSLKALNKQQCSFLTKKILVRLHKHGVLNFLTLSLVFCFFFSIILLYKITNTPTE